MQSYEELLKRALERIPKAEEKSRWEVPDAVVNVSGRQTVVKNFSEICKMLRRDMNHAAKFLFKELAAPGNVQNGMLYLQGKFYPDQIRQRISDYIKRFVLCSECGKPDTDIIKIGRVHMLKCQACGVMRSAE